MKKLDFLTKNEMQSDFRRIATLINTNVFNKDDLQIFQESVFAELMIKLHDLLQKLNDLGKRVDFKDDVPSGKDVTDLVSTIRNAVCHIDSPEHMLRGQSIKFSFNIAYGKMNLMEIGNKKITSDYEDDVCFFFGEHKLYLKRHIVRCVNEIEKRLRTL